LLTQVAIRECNGIDLDRMLEIAAFGERRRRAEFGSSRIVSP